MRTLGIRQTAGIFAAVLILGGCGARSNLGTMPALNNGPDAYTRHRTLSFTGKKQLFKVPAGIKWLSVVALGAEGAGGGSDQGAGGRGGRVHAVIPVSPGERLAIYVGGEGSGSTGGFNGAGGAETHRLSSAMV